MRRQVQAQSQRSGTALAAARLFAFGLLLCCIAALGACGASLSNEFTALDAPRSGEAPSGLHATGDSKPLTRAADTLTSVATPGNSGYKIGPLDVIEFSVFKVPELTRTIQVGETGVVNLPLVGEVRAAGRTARELEHRLARQLGAKYLQSPQVTIIVKEYNSQRVTIEGAVKRPGVYPIRSKTSLLQVIATAEGLDSASDTTVVVFRHIDGKRLAARFDISQIRSGATKDPAIQSGDVIVAPTSAMKGAFDTILKSLPIATVFAFL
ncbi:MAG TPA: polysaccharide biosynthesis/export family protein [Hyphomicrobiaceae bacterium]|nr:polysaccharide biosynthesis/export family protein [Hyphomicrobiaceae bacterium]